MKSKRLGLALLVSLYSLAGCGTGSDTLRSVNTPSGQTMAEESNPPAAVNSDEPDVMEQPNSEEQPETTRAVTSRKGFQLVLLSNWKTDSASQFVEAVRDYQRGIEFTFAPYINASQVGRYQNANTILTGLTNAGRDVSVCVYLSFQQRGTGADTQIEQKAIDFNANFLRAWASNSRVSIAVCPCLEDNGSNADFARWATKVGAKLDAGLRGRVMLRRSPLPNNSQTALPSRGVFAGVQKELHGRITGSAGFYSNDGNFVYSASNSERPASMGGNNPSPQYELGTFKSGTEGNTSTTTLLWRPLYNVFRRTTRRDGQGTTYVYFDKDGRTYNNSSPGFDATERAIARRFLGI